MGVLERLICRQLNRGERFILPLWHEVDERQVFESWPQMCDIFGLKTSIGVPAIVREFRNKIIHVSCGFAVQFLFYFCDSRIWQLLRKCIPF